jgi:thioredoxin-related protein
MQKLVYVLFALLIGNSTLAQNGIDTTPPYKRFPTVPPFKLLQTDSISMFTKTDLKKNKPVLVILFNPDCEHCKHETDEIIKHIDDLKKVQIIMATMAPHAAMKDFYAKYKLGEFKNIKVGRDFQYMLPSFYSVRTLPYLAMYDQKGNLLTTFEGSMKIEELIKVFN